MTLLAVAVGGALGAVARYLPAVHPLKSRLYVVLSLAIGFAAFAAAHAGAVNAAR